MKKTVLLLALLINSFLVSASTITSVTAQQQYPWNGKVDILVTFSGLPSDVAGTDCSVVATNIATQIALPIVHISRIGMTDTGSGTTWTRHFIWDAAADIGEVVIPEVVLTVKSEVQDGVQLWENGPYWAESNVGATRPEDYGYYFWWGDTVGYVREENSWNAVDGSKRDFSFNSGNCATYNKTVAQLRSAGYINSAGDLLAKHDAAVVYLGAPWRMPTDAEFCALKNNCTSTWTTRNGVYGRLVTGKGNFSTKSIFLPAAGNGNGTSRNDLGSYGDYWSSTPKTDDVAGAWDIFVWSGSLGRIVGDPRYRGQSVRPVRVLSTHSVVTHLALDCRSGIRIARPTEQIRYSAMWESAESRAVAVVAVNGEVVSNALGTGCFMWTPTRNGTYTFTHKVMLDGQQIGVTQSATFVAEGLNPDPPIISPASGMVFEPGTQLSVSMSCPSEGASIYYTLDGSEPTVLSNPYKRFKIKGRTTIKARAFYEDGSGSETVVAEYALGQNTDPIISLVDGSIFEHSNQEVSIVWDDVDGALRYTLDGSEPTEESTLYERPFAISETTMVKAKIFGVDFFDSAVVSATLIRKWVKVAMPVMTTAAEFTGSGTMVELSCATPGAQIRYTTNGDKPDSYAAKYTRPFWVSEGCTVKASAICNDYLTSDVASFMISKSWCIGDTMGAPDHAFTTSGNAAFYRVDDATAPAGEAMRSGAIDSSARYGTYNRSMLTTTVTGPGTLSFKWRTSCEADDEFEWDHAEFAVDGTIIARLNDVTTWQTITQTVTGTGEHVVTWTYLKDDQESFGEDCLWVADYSWTPDEPWTHESSIPVPYAWIREKLPHTADEYAAYEAAVKGPAANGHDTVEDAYVAGLEPDEPDSELVATITCSGGMVRIGWNPNLNTGMVTRIYKIYGRTKLDEGEWESPIKPWHRFFKVSVSMPTGAEGEETAVAGEGFVPEEEPGPELGGVQLWEGGPYWAECNVGATKPEENGYYFWWGDTVGYTYEEIAGPAAYEYINVAWVSSQGSRLSSSPFTLSACPTSAKDLSTLQAIRYVDSLGNLVAEHDAATAHLGVPWRLPTDAEFAALISNCTSMWVGNGCLFTGKGAYASKSILLPAAGFGNDARIGRRGSGIFYMSSSVSLHDSYDAWALEYYKTVYRDLIARCAGVSVRPVRDCDE